MPAGTGVCVVNTVPARTDLQRLVEVELGRRLGELADPLEAEEAGVALVGVEDLRARERR